MKKRVLSIITLIFCCCLFGCYSSEPSNITVQPFDLDCNCTLIVNGNTLSDTHKASIVVENKCAVLPFLAIMEELGASVGSPKGAEIKIKLDKTTYYLDLENKTLTENKKQWLRRPIGGESSCYMHTIYTGDELYVDHCKLGMLLAELGYLIKVDYDNMQVQIISKN